jgi:hypothetical protein
MGHRFERKLHAVLADQTVSAWQNPP